MICHKVDNENLTTELRSGEDAYVFQGKGRFLEGTHGHEADARRVVQPDAGLGKEGLDFRRGLLNGFKAAGKEVQGILTGTYDGSALPGLLQADACGEAGQAASYDNNVVPHMPKTCL